MSIEDFNEIENEDNIEDTNKDNTPEPRSAKLDPVYRLQRDCGLDREQGMHQCHLLGLENAHKWWKSS